MYHHEITLIDRSFINDGLQDIPQETKQTVLCKVQSIKRYEFYKMREAGMSPEIAFVVKGYEYNGQDTVEYLNQRYKVARTYQADFEEIELICERVNHND